jgi:cation-transporting ATPase E
VGSIASIISMVPQGLVLITSIAFAVSALKLARQQVLLQELAAVEGLARVDMICFDKTGTLTQGEIGFDAATAIGIPTSEFALWQQVLAFFGDDPDANATAKCLRGQFETGGVGASVPLSASAAVPFSSKRKWSSFAFANSGMTWVLGAPELVLLDNSSAHLDALKLAETQAGLGKRTLVLAATGNASTSADNLPAQLTPVAIVTFKEQVRSDAAQTLSYFKEQGVSVRIISGDNPTTVAAVATEAGLEILGRPIDARELSKDIDALGEALEANNIFGRVTPEQKRNMVAALQSRGHTVAMTGDGVNDALALKMADIGIAMGSGAAATRAVANLVLLNGKFASLPGVMGEGRRVIANIERISKLFLTKTVWAMTLAIVFGLMFWSFPFLPRQLSAVDGFIIGVPAFALALLPNSRRYLPGFLKRSLMFCVPAGLVIAGAVIALELLSQAGAQGTGAWLPSEAQTATSVIFSITGLWVLSSLARPFDAYRLGIIASMSLVGFGFFTITPISDFFGFVSLSTEQLSSTLIIAAAASLLIELAHQIIGKMTRK